MLKTSSVHFLSIAVLLCACDSGDDPGASSSSSGDSNPPVTTNATSGVDTEGSSDSSDSSSDSAGPEQTTGDSGSSNASSSDSGQPTSDTTSDTTGDTTTDTAESMSGTETDHDSDSTNSSGVEVGSGEATDTTVDPTEGETSDMTETGFETDSSSSGSESTSSGNGSSTDSDGSTTTGEPVDCQAGPSVKRYGKIPTPLVTSESYANDAGLLAVFQQMPAEGQTVVLDPPLQVTDATITLTGYFNTTDVWVEDANTSLRLFLYNPNNPMAETFPVADPGMKTSFEVVELKNYFGNYEVTQIQNIQITPAQDQPVHVTDAAEEAVTFDYAVHHDQVFHVYGEVSASLGDCSGGQGIMCYEVLYGGDKTVTLRTEDFDVSGDVGQCIQFTAPLGVFDGAPQFDQRDFDWLTSQY